MGNNHSAPALEKTPKQEPMLVKEGGVKNDVISDNIILVHSSNCRTTSSFSNEIQLKVWSPSDIASSVVLAEVEDKHFEELTEFGGGDREEGYSGDGDESVTSYTESLSPFTGTNSTIKLKSYCSSNVKMESLIGEGEFGKVTKAILFQGKYRLRVAVKAYNAPFDADTFGLLSKIMKLKHRNIVTIKGALDLVDSPSDLASGPQLIVHYFAEGNILQYLSKPSNPQDYATLVKLALDVVQGCEYLHSKNIIHGNLAARNILVEKQRGKMLTHYNAKVSDHGMVHLAKPKGSGKIFYRVHNGKVLPIRWVPKELLDENSAGFTYASDVWSFGIVLWEIFTKGAIPFGRRKGEAKVMELIKEGQSPLDVLTPYGYPNEITDVMKQIFKVNPTERPTFYELRKPLFYISSSVKSQSKQNAFRRRNNEAARRRSTDSWSSGSSIASGRTSEKVNLLRSNGGNTDTQIRFPNDPLKSMESGGNLSSDQSIDLAPMKPYSSESSYQRPVNNAEAGLTISPAISAFHAMSSQTNHSRQTGTFPSPPPPYTPKPPPYYNAYRGRGVRRQRNGGRRVNYSIEIQRKEQELELLKLQKLHHEASAALDRMQSIMAQLTNLRAGPSQGPSSARGCGAENCHQNESYDRLRSVNGNRGFTRNHSHNKRKDAPKLAQEPTAVADTSQKQDNTL